MVLMLKKNKLKFWGRYKFLFIGVFYRAALGEACNGDIAFADSLESFGGGQDDPVSVSIGG